MDEADRLAHQSLVRALRTSDDEAQKGLEPSASLESMAADTIESLSFKLQAVYDYAACRKNYSPYCRDILKLIRGNTGSKGE